MTEANATEIISNLPTAEQEKLSEQFADWYNKLLRKYAEKFEIDQLGSTTRQFESRESVIIFFREAYMFWNKHKPRNAVALTPLEIIQTRVVLGHINSLTKKLQHHTDIKIEELNLETKI